jgi:tRNA(adenine34) deaminase
MNSARSDQQWMQVALEQARAAMAAGEVPVGAIVVKDGQLVATGRNTSIGLHDPTAHAEIIALRCAAQALGNYRLDGCELFVTLEPCAMCSGAMLHARLARVVFGATDPKTGAAGGVVNLFAQSQLNHHTEVCGGILAAQSSALLQGFFKARRDAKACKDRHPLRDDALRTPEDRFVDLPGYPWSPHYLSDLAALNGLRMHYLDEGRREAPLTYLCLHGNPTWSYLYRKMVPIFIAAGQRVVAPDMPGFGKSDKPKKLQDHCFDWHRQVLLEFVERLDLRNIILVVQGWGGRLGLTLPLAQPQRYTGLLVMNTSLGTGETSPSSGLETWTQTCAGNLHLNMARLLAQGKTQLSDSECAAYEAPFADAGHTAAPRAFANLLPRRPDDGGAAVSRAARRFLQDHWRGPSLMAIGLQDTLLEQSEMEQLRQTLTGCPPPMTLAAAGHLVPELGESVATAAVAYFSKLALG